MLNTNSLTSTPDPHPLLVLGRLTLRRTEPVRRDRCTPALLLLSVGHERRVRALAVPPKPVGDLDGIYRCVGTVRSISRAPSPTASALASQAADLMFMLVSRRYDHAEIFSMKGDSYRLGDRDLGRRPQAHLTTQLALPPDYLFLSKPTFLPPANTGAGGISLRSPTARYARSRRTHQVKGGYANFVLPLVDDPCG
jgi:hypothetical protein